VKPEIEGNPLLLSRMNFMKTGHTGLVSEVGVIRWNDDET
jgi:hypothetical protein